MIATETETRVAFFGGGRKGGGIYIEIHHYLLQMRIKRSILWATPVMLIAGGKRMRQTEAAKSLG